MLWSPAASVQILVLSFHSSIPGPHFSPFVKWENVAICISYHGFVVEAKEVNASEVFRRVHGTE